VAGIGNHGIEPWPPGFGAGDPIDGLMNDIEAALSGDLAQVEKLRLRDAFLNECSRHGRMDGLAGLMAGNAVGGLECCD